MKRSLLILMLSGSLACPLVCPLVCQLRADVSLPAIFGDHMVLQQGAPLPVWGKADPGEAVTVSFKGESATAIANEAGRWRVTLKALKGDGETKGSEMRVVGKNEVIFRDVLLGEVWLCSGQSNMAWLLDGLEQGKEDLPKADDAALRFFVVDKHVSFAPREELKGRWRLSTPKAAGQFSAVAYYFGRDLRQARQQPVGLIGSYWGSTPAEAWTSVEALEADPALKGYAESFRHTMANRDQLRQEHREKQIPEWEEAVRQWREEVEAPYKARLVEWEGAVEAARKEGRTASGKGKPKLPRRSPPKPRSVDGNPRQPVVLYNGMIHPVIPYAIKGAIWYQGESNANDADGPKRYETLFPAMVADWRARWGQGDFPFLYVQLAGLARRKFFPDLREAQRKALSMPNSGMAVAIDIGDRRDIHPPNKRDVGRRLALLARNLVYGEAIVSSGPLFRSMQREGRALRITFDYAESGFATGDHARVTPYANGSISEPISGFEVAGREGGFHAATVKVEGSTLSVEAPAVSDPARVRYAMQPFPEVNLYNREGLPAVPFQAELPAGTLQK